MSLIPLLLASLMLVISSAASSAQSAERLFFPFDNGWNGLTLLEEQASLLKELGYDGLGGRVGNTKAKLAALDAHGLKMISCYVALRPDETSCPVPESVKQTIKAYRGRDTIIWLMILGGKTSDEVVVPAIREVADLAAEEGLQVALYPHEGCFSDTVDTCLRLMKKAERPNLGVSFNLCHFLRQNPSSELEATLHRAAPHLKLVQINGADDVPPGKAGWDRLIQPLGEGDLDVTRVLRVLDEVGYTGPVNLQCYTIKEPAREHLSKSMKTWNRWHQ